MISLFTALIKYMPPEIAHDLTIQATKFGSPFLSSGYHDKSLEIALKGLNFKNPLGLAAGFDKNAQLIDPLFQMGFGFVECGTVTPKPQYGNPKPRVHRLTKDSAVINKLGFNNNGEEKFIKNLNFSKMQGVVGANIGPNKDSKNYIDDYIKIYKSISNYADYIAINVSSPNTKDLRELQKKDNLAVLLRELSQQRRELNGKLIMIKIDPDSSNEHYSMMINLVQKYKIDGIIATNTSVSRPDILKDANRKKEGGLSGPPIKKRSDEVLKFLSREINNEIILIGVGGVSNAADVYNKIKLGASLVQLYTALTYKGPKLINQILIDLVQLIKNDGFTNVSEVVGILNK